LPGRIALAVARDPVWFVIGGHAVRCFCPYRSSDDVDFGVGNAKDLEGFVSRLRSKGKVEVLERNKDTVHLSFDGLDVSVFVLPLLTAHIDDRALTATGLLATKLHAILDRGTRRDFFDLYILLEQERMGLVDCFRAMRTVYATDVNEGLLLRAITYFDDADEEAPLPSEGRHDWERVRSFFTSAAGAIITPPVGALEIQRRSVGVQTAPRGRNEPPTRGHRKQKGKNPSRKG
jgi:hypothetical protein